MTPRSTREKTIAQSIEQIVGRHKRLQVHGERLEVLVLRFWAATKHCEDGHSRLPTALFEETNGTLQALHMHTSLLNKSSTLCERFKNFEPATFS